MSTEHPYSPDRPLFTRLRWLADNAQRSDIIEEAIVELKRLGYKEPHELDERLSIKYLALIFGLAFVLYWLIKGCQLVVR